MVIVRPELYTETNYAVIPNDMLRDKGLSLRARGLLFELMSHKPGWKIMHASLISERDGKAAITSTIKELADAGVLKVEQARGDGSRFGEVTYELRFNRWSVPHLGSPDTDRPDTESPDTGSRSLKKPITKEDYRKNTTPRQDVAEVCEHLSRRIKQHATRANSGSINQGWLDAARKLIDIDKVPVEQIHVIIDWSHDSEFWRTNIQSMGKLREKWDTLVLQARRDPVFAEKLKPRPSRVEAERLVAAGEVSKLSDLLGVKVRPPNFEGSPFEVRPQLLAWLQAWWESEGQNLVG